MTTAPRTAFLDLEDTVIKPLLQGWPAFEVCRAWRQTRSLLRRWAPTDLALFSFALNDAADRQGFDEHVRGWLEREVGLPVTLAPTVDGDIIPAICRELRLHPSKVALSDVVEFLGKAGSFRHFVKDAARRTGLHGEVLLLDDSVQNESFQFDDLALRGQIVCIDPRRRFHPPA